MSGLLAWAGIEPKPSGRGPDKQPRDSPIRRLIEELEAEPGAWRRVGSYPAERERAAWSRGSMTVRRHPRLQYEVRRTEAGGVDLYLRVPTAYDAHTTDTAEPKP